MKRSPLILAIGLFLVAVAAATAGGPKECREKYRDQLIQRSYAECDNQSDYNACKVTRGFLEDYFSTPKDPGSAIECIPIGLTHRYAFTREEHEAIDDFSKITINRIKQQR
jgi:hypothetical protein